MGLLKWLKKIASEGADTPPNVARTIRMASHPDAARYVVVDVETTGLSPQSGRIVELAMVTLDSRARVVNEYTTRINPEGPVGATHIHGITDRDVKNAPKFADVLPDIMQTMRGAAVVAHNAPFDMSFMHAEFDRAGWRLPDLPAICTLQASHYYSPGVPRRTLSECCRLSGVSLRHAHSALGDARATAALLARFLDPAGRPTARVDDLGIIERARGIKWPDGPSGPPKAPGQHTYAPRRQPPPMPASQALVEMVSKFSLLQAADAGASTATISYLEKLAEVLADGVLTQQESADLAGLAEIYEFTEDDVAGANRAFLLALAHEALQDGKVAQAERAELKKLAALLNVEEKHVASMLKRAESECIKRMGVGLSSLPQGWSLGEPLRVGDRIVFTGCDGLHRSRLEEASELAGVRVIGAVNKRTALLVTDGSFDGTKAAAARELSIRTVSPHIYESLLKNLQPAK